MRTEHIANGNVPKGPFEFLDVSKSWFSQAHFGDHNGRAYNRVTLAAYHLPLGKIVFPSGVGPDIAGGLGSSHSSSSCSLRFVLLQGCHCLVNPSSCGIWGELRLAIFA